MNTSGDEPGTLVLSYLELRRAVGYLGLALPFAVALGGLALFGDGIQSSISSYYHTGMRDVFVGLLCSIGVFLLSYRGYDRKDAIAGNLACFFAFGVALFPTAPVGNASPLQETVGHIHLGSASLFFSTLAYFSFFLFTKTNPAKDPTRRKLQRNRVYRACGLAMAACLVLIIVYYVARPKDAVDALAALDPVFWLESIAIVAFGISWMVKGEAILRDIGEAGERA